jgi:hypothetical protein
LVEPGSTSHRKFFEGLSLSRKAPHIQALGSLLRNSRALGRAGKSP